MRASSVRFRASQTNTEFEGVLSSLVARMKQGSLLVTAGERDRDCLWRIHSLGTVEAETARPDSTARTFAFYPLPFFLAPASFTSSTSCTPLLPCSPVPLWYKREGCTQRSPASRLPSPTAPKAISPCSSSNCRQPLGHFAGTSDAAS